MYQLMKWNQSKPVVFNLFRWIPKLYKCMFLVMVENRFREKILHTKLSNEVKKQSISNSINFECCLSNMHLWSWTSRKLKSRRSRRTVHDRCEHWTRIKMWRFCTNSKVNKWPLLDWYGLSQCLLLTINEAWKSS